MSDISAASARYKLPEKTPQVQRAKHDGAKDPPGKLRIQLRLDGDTPRDLAFEGRDAWALILLLNAGEKGCTRIDAPGPRWSHFVWKLRRSGLVVETINEAHCAPFAGHHARYVVRSRVRILEISDPQRQRSRARFGGLA
jgi:hypothetical protein